MSDIDSLTLQPRYPHQWHLHAPDELLGINAVGAWPLTRGSKKIKVVVFDTGVDVIHPNLFPNIELEEARDFDHSLEDEVKLDAAEIGDLDLDADAAQRRSPAGSVGGGGGGEAQWPAGRGGAVQARGRQIAAPARARPSEDQGTDLQPQRRPWHGERRYRRRCRQRHGLRRGGAGLSDRTSAHLHQRRVQVADRRREACRPSRAGHPDATIPAVGRRGPLRRRQSFRASAPAAAASYSEELAAANGEHPSLRHPVEPWAEAAWSELSSKDGQKFWRALDGKSEAQLSAILYAAISEVATRVPVVCASGNNGTGSVIYPACLEATIAVGACNEKGWRSTYSQYGRGLDLVAPSNDVPARSRTLVRCSEDMLAQDEKPEDFGVERLGRLGIETTDNLGPFGYNPDPPGDYCEADGDYAFGGTSASAAQVAGVVALMLSVKPDLTPQRIKEILPKACSTKRLHGEPQAGEVERAPSKEEFGCGLIDAAIAVKEAAGPQAPPATASALDRSGEPQS